MALSKPLVRSFAAACLLAFLTPAAAIAQPAKEYEPHVGQVGKDVIWVPTALAMVNKMLDTAKVTAADYVIDLGSGDGRTVITAAKRGIKAHGIEYNPDMVELSTRNAAKEGVSDRATFVKADLFESDFSKATVVTMFLLSDINLRLRPKILDMKPGTRIVSNTFDMGDWKADQNIEAKDGCTSYCRGYFWIVPAKVEGNWKIGTSTLELKQTYQVLAGSLKTGNVVAPISNARMSGDKIEFTAAGKPYTGTVSGNGMSGTVKAGNAETKWQATRG